LAVFIFILKIMLYVILLIGILAVSFASILIKLCDAPSLVIATYRLSFASLFFVSSVGLKRMNPLAYFTSHDLNLAFLSGIFLSIHFATWITSLKYTSVASSVVLVSTAPIFVALGSIIFLKEKLSKLLSVGIGITMVGAVILSAQDFSQGQDQILGDLLAFSGAIGGAGYFLIGRKLRARIDTLAYVTVVYSTTALLLILITALLDFSFVGYDPKIYLLFFLIAFIPQVIGHTSFNWALKYVSAALVSVVTLGEPIGASLLAYLLLGEKITAFQIIGGILILTGVAFAIKGELPSAMVDA
jgi:drug/metabolite transporter (DMT)-like permease